MAAALATTGAAADRNELKVRLATTSEGMVARFEAKRPINALAFPYDGGDVRQQTWVLPEGFTLQEKIIARTDDAPFNEVEVAIRPHNEPTDATYPCLFKIGPEGFGFYAGCFVGDEVEFQSTIEVAAAPGQVVAGLPLRRSVWRVDPAFGHNLAHRYVYVGPHSLVSETRYARFVLPPGPAPELVARIRENVDGAISFYTRKLARPLATKPLIIVAPNFDYEPPGLQGDTTMGPAVALRMFGDRWKTFDPRSDRLDHYVAHEAAHFWNSDTFHPAKGSPAWMWEGSAEVWALATRLVVMKRMTLSGRRNHIESALNGCVTSLFDDPLAGNRSGATYACGETLYWIADVVEKRRTRGRGDIFSIWRRIFDRADSNGGVYTLKDVLTFAVTSDDAPRAFLPFLSGTGTERWHALPDALRPFGVKLAKQPMSHDALRHIAMWHFLNMTCSGTRGMARKTDYLILDTGDRCGPLSGDPEVDALNGHNLFTEMPGAYASAQAACANGGDIVLTRSGKSDHRTFRCTIPLPAAPPHFRIVATP